MKNENSSRLEGKTPKASQNESFGRTMKKSAGKKIGLTIYLLGFAGALLFTILLIREGAHDVVRAVAATGWWLAVIPARAFQNRQLCDGAAIPASDLVH